MFSLLKKSVIFIPLIFLFLAPAIKAVPIVELSSYPADVVADTEFEVSLKLYNLDEGFTYYLKGLGGVSLCEVQTLGSDNTSWLSCTGAWNKMPVIDADVASKSAVIKTKFDKETAGGLKDFLARLVRSDKTSDHFDSDTKEINVLTPTPGPTQTSTQVPTSTPTPTPTPTKTPTPSPTATPKPTKTPTPKPTKTPEVLAAENSSTTSSGLSPDELKMGLVDVSPTPLVEANKIGKIPPYSFIILASGIIFIGLAGYSFFTSQKKGYTISDGQKEQNSELES